MHLLVPQLVRKVREIFSKQLTDDEENLHCDVTDSRAACQVIIIADEAHVVGHRDGHVERGQQNQPVPPCLERAVMKEDEFGFPGICDLVLWQSGWVPKHILDESE